MDGDRAACIVRIQTAALGVGLIEIERSVVERQVGTAADIQTASLTAAALQKIQVIDLDLNVSSRSGTPAPQLRAIQDGGAVPFDR